MKRTVKSSKAENRTARRTSVESARRAIRSANEEETEETTVAEDKDGFEVDEEFVDAVNEETDFGSDNVAKEDVIEAIQAIDVVADSILTASGEEDFEFNADDVIDKIQEVIESDEFELEAEAESPTEDDELPEELNNSVVRVMVQDADGTVTNIESGVEDNDVGGDDFGSDIYSDSFDGDDATMFDTDEVDMGDIELDDEADSDDTELAVVGNSRNPSTNYRKGYMKLSSSLKNENKKVWNSAFKAVKKMIGSSTELTSAHWAIVSMIAKDMAKKESLANNKKVETMKRVLSAIKKSDELKQRLTNSFEEIEKDISASESECKPKEEVGTEFSAKEESTDNGGIVNTPNEVGENWGEPNEPKKDVENANDAVELRAPSEGIVEVDVPVTNGFKTIVMKPMGSGAYKVIGSKLCKSNKIAVRTVRNSRLATKGMSSNVPLKSGTIINLANGKAILLKNSNTAGMLAFYGKFEKGEQKAPYFASLTNGFCLISQSKKGADLFASAEKANLREMLIAQARKTAEVASDKAERVFNSQIRDERMKNRKALSNARKQAMAREDELKAIADNREMERLFQSNVATKKAEVREAQKLDNARQEGLSKLYDSMF